LRKVVSSLVIVLLFSSLFAFALTALPVKAQSGTIYINADGSITPSTANITTHDNVTYTFTGNNYLPIVVNRSNIIINGMGHTLQTLGSENGFSLTNMSNVTIKNTIITNSRVGIWLNHSLGNALSSNNITANGGGIGLFSSSNNFLSGNNVTANSGEGIGLDSSSGNVLSGNNITTNSYGIVLGSFSDNNTLSSNNVTANSCDGIYLNYFSDNNTLSSNSVAANDQDGIHLDSCSNNNILENNVAANTYDGIWLGSSFNNTISDNKIVENNRGIAIDSSSNNTIYKNNVTDNNGLGIFLFSSPGNILTNNIMSCNTYNFGVDGDLPSDFVNQVDASNTVDSKPVCYWINEVDVAVPSNAGFVALINCTGITVQNLSLSNNYEGIGLIYTSNSTITANNVIKCDLGIALGYASKCIISGNNITNNNYDGVALIYSSNCTVWGNTITNDTESGGSGVYLDSLLNCTVSGNNITNNYYGVRLPSSSGHSTISRNNITNNTEDGVYLDSSSNWTVCWNSITNNQYGVYLGGSSNCTVSENDITNNYYGIRFVTSVNCTISGNNVTNNSYYGVWLSWSSNNNRFLHNNFIDNPQQIYANEPTTNAWDDGYPAGGNYWSDYAGVDLNHGSSQGIAGGDGIGDAAYAVINDAKNIDRYPLMAPFKTFNAGIWNNKSYDVEIVSESNITGLSFNPFATPHPALSFDVKGQNGTTGFCRVAIPKDMMWCNNKDEWTITVGSTLTPAVTVLNDTGYTYIYFTYTHSTEMVKITSTNAVPEFQPFMLLPLFMIITLIGAALLRGKRLRKDEFRDVSPLFHS
jgi:parallel beta-helix repeat protein